MLGASCRRAGWKPAQVQVCGAEQPAGVAPWARPAFQPRVTLGLIRIAGGAGNMAIWAGFLYSPRYWTDG